MSDSDDDDDEFALAGTFPDSPGISERFQPPPNSPDAKSDRKRPSPATAAAPSGGRKAAKSAQPAEQPVVEGEADGMCDTVTVSPDASSWQAGFGKLASTLLFAEELSDVKLMANDSDDAISAHRWVLAANSDMMLRMLCPSETSGIKYVEREGHEPVQVGETDATLRSLLSYAYTGRADVAVGNVLAVMKAARYYLVSKERGDCVVACVSFFFFLF